jgi:hypothetical protein
MLQIKPDLTSDQVRTILRSTAIAAGDTGQTPNVNWGYGKINIAGALDQLCATYQGSDLSAGVVVTRGGLRLNRATGHFVQTVTLTNVTRDAIDGPLSLVIDNLTSTASLSRPSGMTACRAPLSPYVVMAAGCLVPGQSATTNLEFEDLQFQSFNYATRVLAGTVR